MLFKRNGEQNVRSYSRKYLGLESCKQPFNWFKNATGTEVGLGKYIYAFKTPVNKSKMPKLLVFFVTVWKVTKSIRKQTVHSF